MNLRQSKTLSGKMAQKVGGCLEFCLQKFSQKLPIQSIKKCNVDNYRHWLGLELQDGRLSLVYISRGVVGARVIGHHVGSFQWHRSDERRADDESGVSRFACVDDGFFYDYEVTLEGDGADAKPLTTCLAQYHVAKFKDLLKAEQQEGMVLADKEVMLLGFIGELLVIQVNQLVACLSWTTDAVHELVGSFVLEGLNDKVKLFGTLLMTLSGKNKASLWDLTNCSQVAIVEISHFMEDCPIDFSLSTDLKHMLFINVKHELTVINLDRYYEKFGHHIYTRRQPIHTESALEKIDDKGRYIPINRQQSTSSDFVFVEKSRASPRFSDTGWKEKLKSFSAPDDVPGKQSTKLSDILNVGDLKVPSPKTESMKYKKAKISGFYRTTGSPKNMQQNIQEIAHQVALPASLSDSVCQDMSMVGDFLSLWMTSNTGRGSWLVTGQVDHNYTFNSSQHHFPVECIAILPNTETCPTLILSAEDVQALAFNTEQEQLVNRLMMYASAGVADSLCCLNSWDRCSIPMHALEVGLKHRQLDTVAFFLKSRENVFAIQELASASEPQTVTQKTEDDNGELDLSQVHAAVQLLITTIKDNISDHPSKQFAEQLLFITLDYLHKVVKNIVQVLHDRKADGSISTAFEEEIDHALNKLTDYIVELRKYLKGLSKTDTGTRSSRHLGTEVKVVPGSWHPLMESGAYRLTVDQRKIVREWDAMNDQDVICDGILQGELALLQAYLHHRGGDSSSALKNLVEFGLERVLHYLQEHQLLLAAQMLGHMGFNVWGKLHQICMYTPDRGLRDYLISQLAAEGHLTEEENDMVKFVHQMEQMYCCPSFEMAKLMRMEGEPRNWESKFNLSQLLGPNHCQQLLDSCGDIAPSDLSNSENAGYAHVLLEWVRAWDKESRQRILLEQILYRKDHQHVEGISAAVVWSYLLLHMDMTRLKDWINVQYPSTAQLGSSAQNPTWPYNLALSSGLLDQIDQAPTYMANQLLDLLARRGVFSCKELKDFPALLRRLARNHALIQQPHLLELRPTTHHLMLIDFHRHMIQYCIQKHLPELLYFYLDYWQLCVTCSDLGEVGMGQEDVPGWVDMMLDFRRAANLESDPLTVFEASLSAHCFVENLHASSVAEMLDKGLTGRALATLMYNPDLFEQVLSNPDSSQDKLREGLSQFPRLQQAIFPPDPSNMSKEVTVYKLLQGNAPFDPSRLFGWQKTNTLATDDVSHEMPHFSHPDLVSRHGHLEQLRFTYYLKQGRPSFAFTAYLIEQLQSGVKNLSVRKLRSVFSKAHHLAIKYFHENHIAAACVAFIEMLGQESIPLRIHIQVANLILSHKCAELQGNLEQRKQREAVCTKEIAHLLYRSARKGRKAAAEILGMLESATKWQIKKHHISSPSWEAAEHWLLAVMFCKLHGLPLSKEYLLACAQSDQWAAFLTFAQVHHYPKDQLVDILPAFASKPLREHLQYVVENVAATAKVEPKALVKGRDVRAQLYSRIGVNASVSRESGGGESSSEEENLSESGTEFHSPTHSHQSSSHSDFTLPFEGYGRDVFSVILDCLEHLNPWRCLVGYAVKFCNPALAVLAACCQNHDLVSCLCGWLAANCVCDIRNKVTTKFPQLETKIWTLDELEELILLLMGANMVRTLRDGFQIFHPECTLLPLLEFGAAFMRYEEPDVCKQHLHTFKQQLHRLQRQSRSSVSEDYDFVFRLEWIEKTTAAILHHFLTCLPHAYEMGLFLGILDQTSVTRLCSCPVADFSRLYQLHQISKNSGVQLDYVTLGFAGRVEYENECSRVLDHFQKGKYYNEARVFAEIAKVPGEQITIQQLCSELEELKASQAWESTNARCAFWRHCHELLTKYRVSPITASHFFQGQIERCVSYDEKGLVCQLAYDWQAHIVGTCDQQEHENLFTEIWKSKIQAHLHKQHSEREKYDLFESLDGETRDRNNTNNSQKSDLLECLTVPGPSDPPKVDLEPEEKLTLDILIGELLTEGRVNAACEVARRLGHYSQDLAIVVNCAHLAQGTMVPEELDASLKKLISFSSPKRSRRISSASLVSLPRIGSTVSLASMPVTGDDSELESDATLAAMGLLSQQSTNGHQCCNQVITSYRIAKVLGESYEWVNHQNEFQVLQAVLSSSALQRFALAKAFIDNGHLSTNQVAGFLSDAILQALQTHLGGGTDEHDESSGGWTLVLRPSSATDLGQSTSAMQLIQLCQDPARLGQRLHDSVVSLLSSDLEDSTKMLTTEVELLIYSHDCHTLACNMEGVSAVLRTARTLTAVLSKAEEYNLMIRLLTGVGRFSEMTYIFDTLKQQHQFELLFRKGIDKEEKLRLSILDYLQRYHPTDSDTFTMVMLHFTMYREIAQMLEEAARKHLKMLEGKSLDNSTEVQTTLQNIVHYYSDAAESYVKENCLRHAQKCVKLARLVALQMHLLTSGQQVINLDKPQINTFVANHGKFYEAYIVSEAYNHHICWPSAILNQVVLHGDFKYLTDFQGHIKLTPEILEEVADRYRSELQKPKQAVSNMKKLLGHCPDVRTAYRLATDMGLTELARELLKGDGGAYLKDTIGVQ